MDFFRSEVRVELDFFSSLSKMKVLSAVYLMLTVLWSTRSYTVVRGSVLSVSVNNGLNSSFVNFLFTYPFKDSAFVTGSFERCSNISIVKENIVINDKQSLYCAY